MTLAVVLMLRSCHAASLGPRSSTGFIALFAALALHLAALSLLDDEVADRLEVLAESPRDVALDQGDRHPRARAQLDRVRQSHRCVTWRRAARQRLHPPDALVVPEVAANGLHRDVAVRERGDGVRAREDAVAERQRRPDIARGGLVCLAVEVVRLIPPNPAEPHRIPPNPAESHRISPNLGTLGCSRSISADLGESPPPCTPAGRAGTRARPGSSGR
mmetsp:Transcript_8791/g.27713  ORF Transcript_8791/g.27713 Transcript_8791/m.27713 type:complete len:218 (+) Transcript_8791:106-759(+)